MPKDHAPIIPQAVFDLYDAYAHGEMDRRSFFASLSKYAVGGMTTAALAACVMPDYSGAEAIVSSADPALDVERFTYASPKGGGEISGDLVIPAAASMPLGGVVVVHENRGLNPHIRDVARRVAKAGYVALAPDALSSLGGYPGNDDDGRALQRQRDRAEMVEDFIAAAEVLRDHPATTGKIACVGFCFGGAVSNLMAARLPWLAGAVPYYGGWPTAEDAARVECPLQIHLAGLDTRVNAGWPDYEAALAAADKSYSLHMYEGVNHGFHNDTTSRYDPAAAALAWSRTTDFFDRVLA
ncbi:MAG: dienelactone hydrolase family protein [Pseudomonadota bacterium]